MLIKGYNESRILIMDDNIEIQIGDKQLLEYKGSHYKSFQNGFLSIYTKFIGLVECPRINNYETVGIYIKPMYVLSDNQWYKIINYVEPRTKHFLYPHLLLLPDEYYNYKPLYTLDTIKKIFELPNTSLELELEQLQVI
jgi:hypothetical protein